MSLKVLYLELSNGECPFLAWEEKLDVNARAAVRIRINRLRLGNFGDCKAIQGVRGLHELRIHLGPGYRIYFGKEKDEVVIILCGGIKKTQNRDITKAKEYWAAYKKG
jgi:putative addiction module killer protein